MTVPFPVILTIVLAVVVVLHESRKIISPERRRSATLSAIAIWILTGVITVYLLQRINELT